MDRIATDSNTVRCIACSRMVDNIDLLTLSLSHSSSDLLISSVVALNQDGRLNLLELLTSLSLLLVFVATIKTLNDLCRLVQPPLLLIYTHK